MADRSGTKRLGAHFVMAATVLPNGSDGLIYILGNAVTRGRPRPPRATYCRSSFRNAAHQQRGRDTAVGDEVPQVIALPF